MSTIGEVLQYFQKQKINYSVVKYAGDQECQYRIDTRLLCDTQGLVISAYPKDSNIDLNAIRKITHRKLDFATQECIARYSQTLGTTSVPPLGVLWNIPTLVESCLFSWPFLEFIVDGEHVVRVDAQYFSSLFPGKKGFAFAHRQKVDNSVGESDDMATHHLLSDVDTTRDSNQLFAETEVLSQLKQVKSLPVMPGIVHQLLRLLGNDEAGIDELVEIVEQDQALSARIVSLARSAHYSFQGDVNSVFDAIYRVIGYDDSVNVALAMLFSHQFHAPHEGRVGVKAIWESSLSEAIVSRYIALHTPLRKRVTAGMSFLAGLLHSIGYLTLAHLFPREYSVLNHIVSGMPETPLPELEDGLMGIRPEQVTVHVLQAWNLPQACIAVCESSDIPVTSENIAYLHCFRLARFVCANLRKDFSEVPVSVREILQSYDMDLDTLMQAIVKDNVAAEVPFLTEIMLG
ncbi:MAG: HDOD domain-containing protein [Gammaproteobacteria bacterium]|nr:HDOD domain-containing protein [Gammaproteobacteria bacterium]